MKKIKIKSLFCFLTAILTLLLATGLRFEVFAQADPRVYIIDDNKHFSETESENIKTNAEAFAEKSGFNIMIVIADDIGEPKTDEHTVEFADDMYDSYCGINTDGVLFLINNDTKYDYISTSGVCINYYSDDRIDGILDRTYNSLVMERYGNAAVSFIEELERYYDMGKANHQQNILGKEVDIEVFFTRFLVFAAILEIIGGIIYSVNAKKYKLEKPSAVQYANKGTLNFSQCTDVFMGNFTTRIYSPRSSGSSSRGGSSGRSSTHRSSSGGRHGGGGRHR